MEKNCAICHTPKPIEDFNKNKARKDGYQTFCKVCQKELNSKYREKHLDKASDYFKAYRKENKDKWIGYNKKYRETLEHKEKREIWYDNNKQYYIDYEQKPSRKEYRKIFNKNSISYKWRQLLLGTLKRIGKSKEGRTIDLLGYSPLQLKEHLEKQFTDGMSWNNHGKWHIDHIRPVSSFSPDTPLDVINALSNLQPLWAVDNIKKSNKFNYA